jgi:hypothetical protein
MSAAAGNRDGNSDQNAENELNATYICQQGGKRKPRPEAAVEVNNS